MFCSQMSKTSLDLESEYPDKNVPYVETSLFTDAPFYYSTCVPHFDMYALAVVAETLLYAIKKGCIVLEKEVSISTGVFFISFYILQT